MTTRKRNILTLFGTALVTLTVVTLIVRGNNNAAAESSPALSIPSVSHESQAGPSLGPEAIATTAALIARESGVNGEITVSLAAGTRAQADAVLEGEPPSAGAAREQALASTSAPSHFCFPGGGVTCSPAELAQAKQALLDEAQAPVYLVQLVANEPFKPAEHLRHGASATYADVMTVVISASTGVRLGLEIGAGSTPSVPALGPTQDFHFAAGSMTAQAAHSEPAPHLGFLKGKVTVAGHPAARWPIAIGNDRSRTDSRGEYEFRLSPASYWLILRRPNGRECAKRKIGIVARQTTVLNIRCR